MRNARHLSMSSAERYDVMLRNLPGSTIMNDLALVKNMGQHINLLVKKDDNSNRNYIGKQLIYLIKIHLF